MRFVNMDDSAAQFVRLWTRFQPEVRRYVFMLVPRESDAEDVLQETSARLWEKYGDYDPQRPFVAWAIGFAYVEVQKWRQRQARERLVFSDELLAQLDATIAAESPLLEVRRRALDGCLNKLGEKERQLLLDRYAEHGAIKQEAARVRISVHKLYYAIEKLRSRLLACIDTTLRKEGWQHG
ncbi:MAG: hypothetical protein C0467_02895 [Planctomycetaceae bacterium]|nr:hypothetical protein [Planctomycetaceae bacterium]